MSDVNNNLNQCSNDGSLPSIVFDNHKNQNIKNELSYTDIVSRDFEASSERGFFDDRIDHHAPTLAPAIVSRVIMSSSSCVDAQICSVSKKGTNRATAVQKSSLRRVRWRDIDGSGDLAEEYATTGEAMLNNLIHALRENDSTRKK